MKVLFASILFLFFVSNGSAQDRTCSSKKFPGVISFQVERQSSGSGHHNFTTLGTSYRSGRSSLYAGALFPDHGNRLEGFDLKYRFFPFSFGANVRPYFQYEFLARWNAPLISEMERQVHDEGWNGKRRERYRTLEHYLGFGTKAPIFSGLFLDLGIGFGFYHSTITSSYDGRIEYPQRFRRDVDVSLSLRGGLGYEF